LIATKMWGRHPACYRILWLILQAESLRHFFWPTLIPDCDKTLAATTVEQLRNNPMRAKQGQNSGGARHTWILIRKKRGSIRAPQRLIHCATVTSFSAAPPRLHDEDSMYFPDRRPFVNQPLQKILKNCLKYFQNVFD